MKCEDQGKSFMIECDVTMVMTRGGGGRGGLNNEEDGSA